MKKLFTAATANNTTKANVFVTTGDIDTIPLVAHCFGTFDTCTVELKASLNGVADGVVLDSFTAAEFVALPLYLPAGVSIWAELSSVGASTSVNLWIGGQGND